MTTKRLLFNARVHTQAGGLVVDSLVLSKNRIVAVGSNLQRDPDFASYPQIDMSGLTITPGLVDAHTHFFYMALSYGRVWLQGLTSAEACLEQIRGHTSGLGKNEWVVGEGFELDRFTKRVELTRQMLDSVTAGRPAVILSKDQHTVWVNSRALKLAGITSRTRQPSGGRIGLGSDGQPNGLLYEGPAAGPVFDLIGSPSSRQIDRFYRRALDTAYRAGVTGVHSFDGPEGFEYFAQLAEKGRLGLRINYYPPALMIEQLRRSGVRYGVGDEFLRVAGVKIFSDGSL
ncbi:MAG: amidohydrolase family protein, partial [candidate division Zixibacteria bacterium]|nr:amidohydrolase family protein [candidate division Zixibacteria bacterium]